MLRSVRVGHHHIGARQQVPILLEPSFSEDADVLAQLLARHAHLIVHLVVLSHHLLAGSHDLRSQHSVHLKLS